MAVHMTTWKFNLNLHSNGSNPFRMVWICIRMPFRVDRIWIRMLRIPFEWFEFAFACFESLSNDLNLHSNASNPFWMVWICIRMLWISFEGLEFAFECFEFGSNASNPFWMVGICIQMLWIPFEYLEFAFECFESLSNGSNWHSNANSNHLKWIRSIRMQIQTIRKGFESFESHLRGWNLHSNAPNLVRMLWIPFEWLEFAYECFESFWNG